MTIQLSVSLVSGAAIAILTMPGCDPVVNIAGANFPAWLFCAIVGTIMAAAFRPLFVAARLEAYLGPLILIYPCLAILLGCCVYLVFFNRV
jgi:CDP-diglyceride synthetase